jgi:UDP-N-acetylglucosamine acyltransferase
MGPGNVVYPFACLGFAPQHAKFDPATHGPGLQIGHSNTFREHVTVHRAFTNEGPTTIGDRNTFMVNSHVGHDCRVGNDVVLVNAALLGGHVVVSDRVIVGGATAVHQFVRVGRGSMLSGGVATSVDVPPFFMLTGINVCGSLNLIGMRRSGMSHQQIDDVRWVYRTVCRQGLGLRSAIEVLRQRAERPLVAEYIAFLDASTRGVGTGRARIIRGATAGVAGEE